MNTPPGPDPVLTSWPGGPHRARSPAVSHGDGPTPVRTMAYPFLTSFIAATGVAYHTSWRTTLVHVDAAAVPHPWNAFEIWTEIAPEGNYAPAKIKGAVIDPPSSPQYIMVRVPGQANLWVRPLPLDDPASSDSGTNNAADNIAAAFENLDQDLKSALRKTQCFVAMQYQISLAPRTTIGPYTLCGGWPRGFKDVQLADAFHDGDLAVVLTLPAEGKGRLGCVTIRKEGVQGSITIRAANNQVEVDTTTKQPCQTRTSWEEAEPGASEGVEGRGHKLIIAAAFPVYDELPADLLGSRASEDSNEGSGSSVSGGSSGGEEEEA